MIEVGSHGIVHQTVLASLSDFQRRVGPPGTRRASTANHDAGTDDLQLHVLFEAGLLKERLRDSNATRIADSDELGLPRSCGRG
jgi:hypothetical protein